MKIRFEGWKRVVVHHRHDVRPVNVRANYATGEPGAPIHFETPRLATGKIVDLGLTGDFLVRLDLEPEELRDWIRSYIKHDRDEAISFLRTMLLEADGPWKSAKAMDPSRWV